MTCIAAIYLCSMHPKKTSILAFFSVANFTIKNKKLFPQKLRLPTFKKEFSSYEMLYMVSVAFTVYCV